MKTLFFLLFAVITSPVLNAQACTPAGDETSYGSSDTWIGYVYDNMGFTGYSGFVNEGAPGNADFNETFGGDYTNYNTNGCPAYTETFSVRYKLTKTFASGSYQITVGGDDGYRLSIDGGTTWIINRWFDQSYNLSTYSLTLSGTYNMVLEYYENGGGNRVSFKVNTVCSGTENTSVYGTGNIWNGYIYTGTNFNNYAGMVTEGIAANPNFDENYWGNNTTYSTSACGIQTEQFSARYRLQKNFPAGTYTFIVGGDDGYRLSLDGGSTWVINNWWDQSYNTSTYSTALNGTVNMVLEFYENSGENRLSFNITGLLPVQLTRLEGSNTNGGNLLSWTVASAINTAWYQVERSVNGIDFTFIGKLPAATITTGSNGKTYHFTDGQPIDGINYYRLRIVDNDGQYNYSPTIKIAATVKKSVHIYPTLVHQQPVFISSNSSLQNGRVELFDMTGRKIQQLLLPSQMSAGQTAPLPLQQLAPGNYVIICRSGNSLAAKQMITVQ